MKINIIGKIDRPNRPNLLKCLVEGFEKHGDTVSVYKYQYDKKADLILAWGLNDEYLKDAIKARKPHIIVENGYVGDRDFKFTAFSINGLNGLGDFNRYNVPGDRWNKYFSDYIKPWDLSGKHAIVAGQCPGDASLHGQNIWDWANSIGEEAKKYYSEVYFRHHPRVKRKKKIVLPLEDESMYPPKVVITHSSNYAVECVLNGIPTISYFKGSMAWDVTSHSLEEPLYTGDRTKWAHGLAYCQWTLDEFASGEAWAHLRPRAVELTNGNNV